MTKTTFEMDGLFTEEDIARRYSCFIQCRGCSLWTHIDSRDNDYTCIHCGGNKMDMHSVTSERTFNPLNKRKIKK